VGASIIEDTLLMLWGTVDMSEPFTVEAVSLSSLPLSEYERPPMDRYFIEHNVSRTWALWPETAFMNNLLSRAYTSSANFAPSIATL
jgi:hypothetical protein